MKLHLVATSAIALVVSACTSMGDAPLVTTAPATEIATEEAADATGLSALVDKVDIPYESFTLDNGLTVIVHTDRKAPIVGVTTYYRVGSKHEPRGRTGFAHLFEHLMFGGSENVENFDIPLEAAGSTSTNGSTNFDRTNYVETVPTGALDLALMMESDRMGYLLGAISQEKLDKQRGVVQNEKRQGDNQPYGLTFYTLLEGLFPVGHPYRHSTIGSMADLDAASLTDVRNWFIKNYAPNNVVLSLTGDIDAATARPMVERWFGDIPGGPEVEEVKADPVTLASDKTRELIDQVPQTRVYRAWTGPGLNHPDAVPLDIGMSVLGGLASSRLDNVLVRDEQLATSVSAYNWQSEDVAILIAQMDIKPGVDRAAAEKRLDEVIAQMVAEGPTEAEVARASTSLVSSQIDGLERVGGFGGKGSTLAEGLLYSDDPAFYKQALTQVAALSPAQVSAAMERWLSRPVYKLAIVPGERVESGADMGGWGDEGTVPAPQPDAKEPIEITRTGPPRDLPEPEDVGPLTFPTVERATLSNGISVTLARRTAVPKLVVSMQFDAGYSADGSERAGTQSLMMDLLEEGTTSRSAVEIAEEQERLGASIGTGTSLDTSSVTMNTLTSNLAPSLALMADIVRNPAFAEGEVQRVRDQRLAEIAQQLSSPGGLAGRTLRPIIFGEDHPYGTVGSLGTVPVVEAIGPAALRSEHQRWIRPDNAEIFAVGDITMPALRQQLEAAFGNWQAGAGAAPVKSLDTALPDATTRVVVIDRPNSPQSVIYAGRVLPLNGPTPGLEALELANEVLGNGFLSRLNMIIREEKGWSYGARSSVDAPAGPRLFTISTAVQSDRTADSIRLILDTAREFADGTRSVDETEFTRVTDGNIRGLPNRFETNSQVLRAIVENDQLGRPDDYYTNLPATYRAIDTAAIDAAAARYLGPDNLTIVVVGDRSEIDAQLETLDLPIEVRELSE
ncbi:Predicted Zn-dependent peptidase [Altererythrobacter xiamenensis]|uniref:Predicted Zn-dependent peptidase n=1 Tax=Altererythrobacter xiamenensis TaxID=1316679 RepID=A0A1Y6EPV8_9SPHN|nr:pitrilysin family protein [Altererythrobacter xiamenensis]SMQ62213.1 Predicted Zn-dependent peptidase [Altererythrobacter xiamenensis]